ncbi:MAG: ribosomal RNA small subunit methyltransferase A [Spirochaetales bacterium]|nr:ribosomal RNA small subunit methyltransferase A [Spirochaetales bacterium]
MMGLGPRKRWGQNFLINSGARERIVNLLDVKPDQLVWEIGPGLGSLTSLLMDKTSRMTLFEIDPGYCEYLQMAFDGKGPDIVEGDVMKTWQARYAVEEPDRLIGNLPYNAASAIISDFIENDKMAEKMLFTVQHEMGDRMKASPGSKNYSSFSILCQFGCRVIDRGVLSAGSFYPAPRVSSKIMEMIPLNRSNTVVDRELFFRLVRDMFISRRKTLKNNIAAAGSARFQHIGKEKMFQAFTDEGIKLESRPERISVDEFIAVANRLAQ